MGRPVALHAQDPELPALLKKEGVRVLGYLSEEELAAAYAHAQVFCYPSLEEGFGLPLLEAMSVDCPVVTSNVSCLPEIAGPAAVLVDPYSVEAIAGRHPGNPESLSRRARATRRRRTRMGGAILVGTGRPSNTLTSTASWHEPYPHDLRAGPLRGVRLVAQSRALSPRRLPSPNDRSRIFQPAG